MITAPFSCPVCSTPKVKRLASDPFQPEIDQAFRQLAKAEAAKVEAEKK